MIYKKNEEQSKNQLLEVIINKYDWKKILLFYVSFIFIGIFLDQKIYEKNKLLAYFLFGVSFFTLVLGIYPFLKSSLLKIKHISWPSIQDIFFNIFCVILFTLILISMVYLFDKFIHKYLFKYLSVLINSK
ncbi:Preprotein translocase subunit SecE [Candidatus Phytoplasma mali]|uniref:Preprotein translocase subunit SecE n=1 Tax=Phytoplasma mali (strain AT) TaxID=482235 RepID=B3QZG4_PHYMT|nr:preprotein translocase subunit SecE [Candidatus Phytoplasma mali]CAP18571.1 Preprotein translocase subunit SecE [Candidatus Phytoplasma mali]